LTGNPPSAVRLNRDDVERTVITLISRNRNCPESQLGPDTDLIVDLGIAGDDADDILLQVAKVYRIDFSGTGLAARFGTDALSPWQGPVTIFRIVTYPFARWVLGRLHREIIGPGVLVRDIVDAVMAKASKSSA